MKIDEYGKFVTLRQVIENGYCWIRENTAQIAVAIPIMATILSVLVNYCHFLTVYGYYYYFEIDTKLMLPYNSVNLYQMISLLFGVGGYWLFAVFAVRMFFYKKNFLGKIVCWVVIPIVINGLLLRKDVHNGIEIPLMLTLLIIQWIMIWALGYCFAPSFHDDIQGQKRKKSKRNIRKSSKLTSKWRRKDDMFFGLLLMLIALILGVYQIFSYNYDVAKNQTYYGIVEVAGKEYAVIDGNIDKVVLQECLYDENKKEITIYTNTYLCINNNVEIVYDDFNDIKKEIK